MILETPLQSERALARSTERRGILHTIFSFPGMLAALLVVLTSFTVRNRFSDPDLWWHLKTGELIWKTHSIPRVDVFSFTAAGQPWTAQEWLSQVVIYGAYRLGGYSGLMLWLCVMASLLVLAGYALAALYSRNVKVAFLGGMVTWLFATVGLAIRPHLIGYLLLICEMAILHLGRERDRRWFYALPPLFALWINFHSSFVFGFVVLGVMLGCSFLDLEWGLLVSESWNKRKRNALAFATALSAAALLLNPIGPKLVWYPFEVMFNQPVNLGSVTEWQQTDFSAPRGVALLIVLGLIVLVPLLRCVKLQLQELLLMALLFYFGVRHERMVFLFGILAGPILCRLLADTWDRYQPERDRILPNAILMLIAVVTIVLAFPNSRYLREQVDKGNPVNAVEFIKHSGLGGRILNGYMYGGYLIWAAPERKVFVDGRADVYEPAGVLGDYVRVTTSEFGSKSILDKYRIDFCFFPQGDPITRILALTPGWKKVYSDTQSVIFARQS